MTRPMKITLAGGIVMTLCLVVGPGAGVLAMMRTFQTIAEKGGTASPADLEEHIGRALWLTAIFLSLAGVGFCVLIGGLIAHHVGKKRQPPASA